MNHYSGGKDTDNPRAQKTVAAGWIEDIRDALRSGRLVAAYTILSSVMPHDAESPELNNLLGAYYEKMGDLDAARKRYRMVLILDPSYAPAMRNLERLTAWKWHGSEENEVCDLGDASGDAAVGAVGEKKP